MIVTTDSSSNGIRTRTRAPWQYSLKGLLGVFAIVSVCLAIGVHFAGWMFVLVTFGLFQAGILLAADWLIRPENRKWLAIVTAVSWAIVGSGLLVLGIHEAWHLPNNGTIGLAGSAGILLIVAGVFCYGLAFRRWRQLAARNGSDVLGPKMVELNHDSK